MILQESGENYLEMILVLQNKNGTVRSIDIANAFAFTKASVSRAMNILKKEKLILMEPNGNITLTKSGLDKANSVLERHLIITQHLESLGVSSEIAEKDACRIEHIISPETFAALKLTVKKC